MLIKYVLQLFIYFILLDRYYFKNQIKFCNLPIMSSCFAKVKNILKFFDLFPYSNFLRYNGDDFYSTSTGGILSIGVIVIFFILFASMGIKTLNKKIIFTTQGSEFVDNPSQLNMIMGPEGGFMFGILVFGVNLNNASMKVFDVKMYQEEYTPLLQMVNSTEVPLVACTEQHLNFNSEVKSQYTPLYFYQKLCPAIGQQTTLKGKVTSDVFKRFKVTISRCNNTVDPTCISDAMFNSMEAAMNQWMVGIPIINYLLNPSQEEYKDFYIQDRNRFSFSSTLGTNLIAEVKEDIIENDISLLPFQDIQEEKIVRISQRLTSESYIPAPGQPLMTITFRKSPETTTYNRSFNKFDQYFSYVGGLIGTIIGFMIIMERYNEKAYEISLAHKLFKDKDNSEIPSSSINIGYYFLMRIKEILDFFGCDPKWEKTQTFIDCSQEISCQLDITYILRKLLFLDAAFSKIMEKHQIEALCLREKPTIQKAKETRKTHFAYEMFKQFNKQKDKINETTINPLNATKNQSISGIMINEPAKNLNSKIAEDPAEREEKKYSSENVSEVELSEGQQVNQIALSVRKVIEESLEGRAISKKILEDINELTLKKIEGLDEQNRNQKNEQIKQIEEGKQQVKYIKVKSNIENEFQYI